MSNLEEILKRYREKVEKKKEIGKHYENEFRYIRIIIKILYYILIIFVIYLI